MDDTRDVVQVEISKSYSKAEWREDLKKVMRKAGGEGKPCVFLFSDTQIKDEAFVEDINNLLNAGEVPNMFPMDERMQVTYLPLHAVPSTHVTPAHLALRLIASMHTTGLEQVLSGSAGVVPQITNDEAQPSAAERLKCSAVCCKMQRKVRLHCNSFHSREIRHDLWKY